MIPLMRRGAAALGVAIVSAVACGGGSSTREMGHASLPSNAPANSNPVDNRPIVVFLGDSLTAGLGLAPDQAYPALIQQRIDEQHLAYRVVNAGVSGDTSAGGASRLDWALDGDVRVLLVALGGNDGLRGLPPEELERNLAAIIERAQQKRIAVILAGMEAPPNFGDDYTKAFRRVYPDLAKRYGVPLIPFLLDGVAGSDVLNQADGIHPTPAGARIVADTVWRALAPVLTKGARHP
jgi:acyl-CoA thioesterase-1